MLKNITPSLITQTCAGTLSDGSRCGQENQFPFAYLQLGVSLPSYLEIGDQAGGLRLFPKKDGVTLELVNGKTMRATAAGTLTGDALSVALADNGTAATSLYSELKAAIEAAAPALFTVLRYGADAACPELAVTALDYVAAPRGDKNGIRLPRCSNCDGVETLLRDFAALPAAYQVTQSGRHKMAVNFLGDELKRQGQLHPQFASAYTSETPAFTRTKLPGWPAGGDFLVPA